jgi:prepilin-type N-terminal cleavage/methylation domain-containing protein
MPSDSRPARLRRAMTLIELLVVVVIILTIAAVTIPRLRPDLQRSRIREAARSVQLYFSSARNQAMTTGRDCGVQIDRLANYSSAGVATPLEPGCSMSITQVEMPVGYCGELIPSMGTVSLIPPATSGVLQTSATVNVAFGTSNPINETLITQGDLIQLDMQGPMYTVAGIASNGTSVVATADISEGQSLPWPVQGAGGAVVPYKFFRQPVKSTAGAMQLPSPSVIDLTFSGPDPLVPPSGTTAWSTPWYASTTDVTPIQIMFAPDGSVDRVYVDGQYIVPTTNIYLLIGLRQNVNDPSAANWNIQDFNNLWISINPRTGLIVTVDQALTPGGASPTAAQVYASRAFGRQSDAMGGN